MTSILWVLTMRVLRPGRGTTSEAQQRPKLSGYWPAVSRNRPPDIVASLQRCPAAFEPNRQTILGHHMGKYLRNLILSLL